MPSREMFRGEVDGDIFAYYSDGTIECWSKEDPQNRYVGDTVYWEIRDGKLGMWWERKKKWILCVDELQEAYGDFLGKVIVGEEIPKRSPLATVAIAVRRAKWWYQHRRLVIEKNWLNYKIKKAIAKRKKEVR